MFVCFFYSSSPQVKSVQTDYNPEIKGSYGGFKMGPLTQPSHTQNCPKYPEGFVQNRYGINKIEVFTAAFLGWRAV